MQTTAESTLPIARPVAATYRQMLADGRQRLRDSFLAGESVTQILRQHCRLVDSVLDSLWAELALPPTAALIATGGYGRGQLFPYSDVDVLILLPDSHTGAFDAQLESLVGLLWDIGLEIGHSVRTVPECVDQARGDLTIQTNLLEARLVTGNRRLFRRFSGAMAESMDARAFCRAKQLEQQQRHARHQDTAYNLEPNLKENPGGLRDLQTILWISRGAGLGRSWADLVAQDLITAFEAQQLRRHEVFLQSLRVRLHYAARRREDRLLFDWQGTLAHDLGFRDRPTRLASEQFMQRYYRTAKAVQQLNTILLQNLQARISPSDDERVRRLDERFQVRGELLEIADEQVFQQHPSAVLECFVLLAEHPELRGMSAPTLRALYRARDEITPAFRRNPRNRELFMRLLRQPARVHRELRRMNQYGILGQYIPAFGRVVGQMQFDLFHAYTVDEHILRVIRNLRRFAIPELAHEYPLCSRLISDFARPEVLYLAGMFHDIAKGRGGDHSALGAIDARRFCVNHGLSPDDVDLVVWLVESHLIMSSVAQKQDLADPDVIDAFAARVGDDRRLVALYLLTNADIRGTSPKVWNAWKGKLLEDLFWLTRRKLSGDLLPAESSIAARQDAAVAKLRLYGLRDGVEKKLWAQLDTGYFLRHDSNEIAWHTRHLNYRVDTTEPVVKARLSPIGGGLEVMIYAPDRRDLFAQICCFFSRLHYSIAEARIYTTRHGYALDTFHVLDPDVDAGHYRDLISLIEHELTERLKSDAPLEPPGPGRLSRQLKHFPITPQVIIRPDEKNAWYMLQIIAGDRQGLLARIARTLVDYGVGVQTAKVNTLGERAEDTFVVTGSVFNDARAVVRLEADLAAAVA